VAGASTAAALGIVAPVFGFLQRDRPNLGLVFLPGDRAPGPEDLERLRAVGVSIEAASGEPGTWARTLRHPRWGEAIVAFDPAAPSADELIRDTAPNLDDAERAAAMRSRHGLSVRVPAARRHALHDRKTLLRWFDLLLGEDGVVAVDLLSQLPWPRQALADELAHDADVDIEALYTIHLIYEEGAEPPVAYWLHTHGLADLGAFDLDLVAPHPAFTERCGELFRAVALQALDDSIQPDTDRLTFGHPDGDARLVPAARFMREAGAPFVTFRDAPDHEDRRAVLCEPSSRGFLGLGRRDAIRPLRFAQRPPPDRFVSFQSEAASELMAERARLTLGVLEARWREFAEFEVVPLVKLGYPTPDQSREHLWFELHAIDGDQLDATLVNRPFKVDLRVNERAMRPVDLLTDWVVTTPAGQITPRSDVTSRRLREHADELREAMRKARR
jgi:hypothetical protein